MQPTGLSKKGKINMKKTTKLLFGIHMHQPIDNFEWVITKGVDLCYGPFFATMRNYPEFKFSLHCSGWLLEQIKKNHPKVFKDIAYLAKKGSIEFLSAGYYEPILSAIPSCDRVAQIELLNEFIKKEFNQTPKGLWLTERVWESGIIPDLKSANIEYTLMDDYHFESAGFDEKLLDGYFMSEEGGEEIALFPINKKLRYAIPFLNVETAIQSIKSFNREDDSAAIIFDDAEKFGMWPGTFTWVYEKKWLERFVCEVLKDEEIQTLHFYDYYKNNTSRGIAYLPNVSYYEMGEWSLRAEETLKLQELKDHTEAKHLRGGIWKNFLVKYTESNRIHKRTLELSKAQKSVNKKSFNQALYKSQANDSLWHGVFGGLYLPNLRDNVYTYIIEAENIRYGKKTLIESNTNELDGHNKYKCVTQETILRFDAGEGAQLVEFDVRSKKFNYQNSLMRRHEAYHELILHPKPKTHAEHTEPKEGIDTIHHANIEVSQELQNALIYDWHPKNSFVDHITNAAFNAQNFKYANFREFGDFANQPFESKSSAHSVSFTRHGGIYNEQKYATTLHKTFTPHKSGVAFEISLKSEAQEEFFYVLEQNFHFSEYEKVTLNGTPLQEIQTLTNLKTLEIGDDELGVKIVLHISQSFDLHAFKLSTLSQSEEGFDLSTQGVSFALVFAFCKKLELRGTLEISDV